MPTVINRAFVVDVPLEIAWRHLARVESWPSWAKHIKAVELTPPGDIGPQSRGMLRLRNGLTTRFQMQDFAPCDHWTWIGRVLWLTLSYYHTFGALSSHQTQVTFLVTVEGWGVPLFGPLFAGVYNRYLDSAIPHLIAELNAPR
jgi:Polyketide cyclase / dehydrase and lipid transport